MTKCVHNIAEAMDVLRNAAKIRKTAILQHTEEMADYAGLLYIREMYRLARQQYPQVQVVQVFDAGEDPALAIIAMKDVFDKVRFQGSQGMRTKLEDIARQLGKELVD